MSRDFVIVWQHSDALLAGLANTVWLSATALVLAAIFGCLVAALMLSPQRPVKMAAGVLVDGMRCIPFLLFAYLIYFGLPQLGIRFDSWTSGLVALILYHTAYMAEIIRGAWVNLAREQIEAGKAFGLVGLSLFRRIILPQIFFAAAPLVGNEATQIVRDSAFLMIITVAELTFAANSIQSTYFVPFASFIVAMGLYWILTIAIEGAVRRTEAAAALRRG